MASVALGVQQACDEFPQSGVQPVAAMRSRKDERFPVAIRARIRHGNARADDLVTDDVSYRGAFLQTLRPPPLRQLVRVEFMLHAMSTEVRAHAVPVHVLSSTSTRHAGPGVGLHLWALEGEARSLWEGFVDYVRERGGAACGLADGPTPRPHADRARLDSRHPRTNLSLECSQRELEFVRVTVLPRGSLFVRARRHLPVGADVCVNLIHPQTGKRFPLLGVVQSIDERPERPGVTVRLAPADARLRAEFDLFEMTGNTILEDDTKESLVRLAR